MRLSDGTNVSLCLTKTHTQLSGLGSVSTSSLSAGTPLVQNQAHLTHGDATASVSSYVYRFSVFGRPCILTVLHPIWLLQSFCLLFHRIPEPWGRDLASLLALNVPWSLTLLAAPQWIPAFVWSFCFYAGITLFLLLLLIYFEIKDGDTSRSSFVFFTKCFSFHF